MLHEDTHLSDQQLLQFEDGELSAHDAQRAGKHLAACWDCRSRKLELERTISEFVHLHHESLDRESAASRRALERCSKRGCMPPRTQSLREFGCDEWKLLSQNITRPIFMRRSSSCWPVWISIFHQDVIAGCADKGSAYAEQQPDAWSYPSGGPD